MSHYQLYHVLSYWQDLELLRYLSFSDPTFAVYFATLVLPTLLQRNIPFLGMHFSTDIINWYGKVCLKGKDNYIRSYEASICFSKPTVW